MSITALQTRISRPRRNDTILLTPLETDTFIRASAPPSSITCAITQSSSWCEDSDEKPFLQRRTTLQLILEDFFSGDPAQHQRELARIEQQARDLHDRLARLNVDLRFGHAEDQCGGSKAFEQMVAEIEREQEAARKSKVGRVTERLARFFENVSKMKDVVDTMVSSNPQYSALVWGGVKFLMMGVMNHHEMKQQIAEKMVDIMMEVPSLELRQGLFRTAAFTLAVKSLSLNFMEFLVIALEWLQKPRGIKKAMRSVFEDFNSVFEEVLAKISRSTKLVDTTLKDQVLLEQRNQSHQISAVKEDLSTMAPQLNDLTAIIPLIKSIHEHFSRSESLATQHQASTRASPLAICTSPSITAAAAFDLQRSYLHSMAQDDLLTDEHHCTCRYIHFSSPTSTTISTFLRLPPSLCPSTKLTTVTTTLRNHHYHTLWKKLPNLAPLSRWTHPIIVLCLPRHPPSYIASSSLLAAWHFHCSRTAETRTSHRRVALIHFFPGHEIRTVVDANNTCLNITKSLLLQLTKSFPDIPARAGTAYLSRLSLSNNSTAALWRVIHETISYITPDTEVYVLLNLLPANFPVLRDAEIVLDGLRRLGYSKRRGPKVRVVVTSVMTTQEVREMWSGVEVEVIVTGLVPMGAQKMIAGGRKELARGLVGGRRNMSSVEAGMKQRRKLAGMVGMERARASIY